MSKLLCTATDHHNNPCGGILEKRHKFFCTTCKDRISKDSVGNAKNPKCQHCGKELIRAYEYICKKCRAIPDMMVLG